MALSKPVYIKTFSYHPVNFPEIEKLYKRQVANIWTAEEIDLSLDIDSWKTLAPEIKHFIERILSFFSEADGLVNLNITSNFTRECGWMKEATWFYQIQMFIETVHNETYGNFIHTFIPPERRVQVSTAMQHVPTIHAIRVWMEKWMEPSQSFLQRLIAFGCVESVLFQSAFAGIYKLKQMNVMPGLTFSNELIARDETLHRNFAVELLRVIGRLIAEGRLAEILRIEGYEHLIESTSRLPTIEEAQTVIREAVEVTVNFTREALGLDLIGLSVEDMISYIEAQADALSVDFGYPKIYNSVNKLDWMSVIELPNRSNFFEKKVSEYQKKMAGTIDYSVKTGEGDADEFAEDF